MSVVTELRAEIDKLTLRIKAIQAECSHPRACLDVSHRASTGNYDPTQDCYWTDFTCGLCQKFWTEEGSK